MAFRYEPLEGSSSRTPEGAMLASRTMVKPARKVRRSKDFARDVILAVDFLRECGAVIDRPWSKPVIAAKASTTTRGNRRDVSHYPGPHHHVNVETRASIFCTCGNWCSHLRRSSAKRQRSTSLVKKTWRRQGATWSLIMDLTWCLLQTYDRMLNTSRRTPLAAPPSSSVN